MTNAQRKALSRMAEMNSSGNNSKPDGYGKFATPDNKTRHTRFPLSNFPPQAGERANESLREFHVKPTLSSAFCPHEAGAYYLATVGTVAKVIKLFAREIEPPVYTYAITTIHFEQDPDTGRWIWFDGKEKLSPRKNQDGWRLGSKTLYDTRVGAEAELQRMMVKNGDRVTKVHDLPDDMTKLKKIRSAHHPDRNNPDMDHDLYQAVIEKMDRMRAVTQ